MVKRSGGARRRRCATAFQLRIYAHVQRERVLSGGRPGGVVRAVRLASVHPFVVHPWI